MGSLFNHVSDLFKPGVLLHIIIQKYLQKTHENPSKNINEEMANAGFKHELIKHNIKKLTNLVQKLSWRKKKSTWSNYISENNYSK